MSLPITRRGFLRQASCAAVGSTAIVSTLLNLRLAAAAAAQDLPLAADAPDDYRALVCLFLAGGQDSYNFLAPAGAEHAAYATTRGGVYSATGNPTGLALDRTALLALPAAAYAPLLLGLHPSTGGLHDLFTRGKLALVANVGTLVERTTKAQYTGLTAKLPRGLYSHSDQQQQWHTAIPTESRLRGWAGLAADLLHAGNADRRIGMNLSLSGNNVWQSGRTLYPYSVSASASVNSGGTVAHTGGAVALSDYSNTAVGDTSRTAARTAAVNGLLAQHYENLLEQTFASNFRDSLDSSALYSAALAAVPVLATKFPGETGYSADPAYVPGADPARNLAAQLKQVVRSIAVRGEVGHRRETFFINYGGWDHHDEVIATQAAMLDIVSRCLAAFYAALEELGVQDQVTLFSASDFGRTLTSNGNGSDHAWGGNHFVLGGAVNGGRVYGAYPDLALGGSEIVTGRGVTIPSLSVDEYFAELALWLGVSPGRLAEVLPRIATFYLPGATGPLGMMQA